MHFHTSYPAYLQRYPTKLLALYHALRDGIVGGVLEYGTRLPSTRELAALYGLSRGTVGGVYDMLASEGYLACRTGSGTFVAFRRSLAAGAPAGHAADEALAAYPLTAWARGLQSVRLPVAEEPSAILRDDPGVIDFRLGAPDLSGFPQAAWNRCLYAAAREASLPRSALQDGPAQGCAPLREAIAQYLRRARGMAVQAGQVAVTGGSMQALALLAQLLVGPGGTAVAETPAYTGIRRAVLASGGRCIDAAVDGEGIVPDEWEASALFVTPTRQFPTGAVLSMERRQRLLEWAHRRGAVIIEDDYDSEFRHRGKSLEPLQVLGGGRVVYVGSFTKSLLPQTRIGYAVLPPALVGPFVRAQALYTPYPVNLMEQKALAAFMNGGEYERHLRRMKRTYGRKFYRLMQLVTERLTKCFDWTQSDAGLHLFGWWRGSPDSYLEYRARCRAEGVFWSEADTVQGETIRHGIYLCFSQLTEQQLETGVLRMAEVASGTGGKLQV